jgi:CRISPR-associated endonuclease/helicase Cas3
MRSLNEYRERFRQYAKSVNHIKPTIYSLVLPTGGGKTLTGLTLAARLNDNNINCIYVCPRNSILEQTKKIYQKIFGKENILVHYGYPEFITNKEERNFSKMDTIMWNSPIILTSYVQFFESLFHHKVPKLIKFSELYGRTIIIDETQLMSLEILNPTLMALEYLVDELQCSIVLMSATPPDFSKTILKDRIIQTIGTPEDIDGFCKLADNVDIHYKNKSDESIFDVVTEQIDSNNFNSILYVANTIEQAKNVFDLLQKSYSDYKVFCLTTNNVTMHRKEILKEVEGLLNTKEKIILVSTSIVEAGVDVDFDIGFREMTNLNSIVQVAGRVKRNRRDERGNLFVLHCTNKKIIPCCVSSKDSEIQTTLDFLQERNIDINQYNKKIAEYAQYDYEKVIDDMKNPNTPYLEITKKMKIISNDTTQLYLKNYNEESQTIFQKVINDLPFNISKYMEYVINVYDVNKFQHKKWLIENDPDRIIYTYEGTYDLQKGIIRC